MKLTINIDKEVLFMTRYCKYKGEKEKDYFVNPHYPKSSISNCAIDYAVQKIFPLASVSIYINH